MPVFCEEFLHNSDISVRTCRMDLQTRFVTTHIIDTIREKPNDAGPLPEVRFARSRAVGIFK